MSLHPIQLPNGKRGHLPAEISSKAYEVYSHFYGTGQSLERLNERGGFHVSEIIELLYIATHDKEQWSFIDRSMSHNMDLRGNSAV